MKNILIVSQYFYPESFRINDIASNLVKRGYKVTVLTGYPNYPEGNFYPGYTFFKQPKGSKTFENVSIIRLPIFPRGKRKIGLILNYFSFWILGHIFVLFTRLRFDLVFTYGVSPLFQGGIANHYARKFKVSSFLYLMDFWPFSISAVNGIRNGFLIKLVASISRKIYLKTNRILISSQGYRSDLIKMGISSEKIFYWPQYHESFYRPLTKNFHLTPEIKDDSNFKLCFTGNFGYGQGIIEFLLYLQTYQNELRRLGTIFYFIGDGRAKSELQRFILDYGINDLAILIPRQTPEKITQYLANIDVALLLIKNDISMTKVLPAKVSSYVGCKKPIFCVANGDLSNFINENKLGIGTNGFEHHVIHKNLYLLFKRFKQGTLKDLLPIEDCFQSEVLLNQLDFLFHLNDSK
jgi:hypothetical protein